MFLFNPPSCTTQFTNFQVTNFGLQIQPSSDVFIIKSYAKTLIGILLLRLRSHFLPTNVTKHAKIHKSCVKL